MYIVEVSSGDKHEVLVLPVEESDYKQLTKTRFYFAWKAEVAYEVYKLLLIRTGEVLGLVSLERIPEEWRVHIRLLSVSKENAGKHKKYDRVAGNLIAHASKIAVRSYAELACVSLKPKSHIAQHYIDQYGMRRTGMTLSLEVPEILDLISYYSHD
ncbi:MAG: N-acetyltransferase [Flavobacteriales bacterium]|nr:N-acetyltransferase [Flavobacteriales bacterium]